MKPDTIILTQQSFDKLFRLYQRKLYAVAYSLVHDANTAEDIVHDSFMTIWENRETVQYEHRGLSFRCRKKTLSEISSG